MKDGGFFDGLVAKVKGRKTVSGAVAKQEDAHLDAALGAFVGLCVGDAAGAVLEFSPEALSGSVPPDKVTDDSELAISLAQALSTAAPPSLPVEAIATAYAKWYDSGPFDMGLTCQTAFSSGSRAIANGEPVAPAVSWTAEQGSMNSQANGALMRIAPLAIWAHRCSADLIADWACQDAALSHPNRHCQEANAAYCIAIAALIRAPGDAESAIAAAKEWLEKNSASEVKAWFEEALRRGDIPAVAGNRTDGWVRWGFTLAFRHLARRSTFEAALRDTLARGGDVDTNAAIVGGLLGALWGESGVPRAWREPVVSRGPGSPGARVADHLTSDQVPGLAAALYRLATPAA